MTAKATSPCWCEPVSTTTITASQQCLFRSRTCKKQGRPLYRACGQDMDVRKRKRQLELLWRGSESLGSAADLFTGNFASGNYGPPPGFNWDWGQEDPQMQARPCP